MQAYAAPAAMGAKFKIAIVVSGLGVSASATKTALDNLPAGITLGFAPYAGDVGQWVSQARGRGHEVLVYEIGVRKAYRRVGIGRALMTHMESWMRDNNLEEMWLAADNPGAEHFYKALGYARREPEYFQPVYMSRELD